MSISIEARVWLATHLLYPNSTQAFDVYQAIVSQSDRSGQARDTSNLLLKLSQICEKIPAVSSSLTFHVFEDKPMDKWVIIYKKAQKIQQLIFIGVLIFDMSIEDISTALKITSDKTRFLFHQTFKKVVQFTPDIKTAYDFQFKKNSDQKVSYLFTNENLIEFSLGQLSAEDSEKVKIGLNSYPVLQNSHQIYEAIISQVKNLVQGHASYSIEIPQIAEPVIQKKKNPSLQKINQYKKPISISVFSLIMMAVVFMRPRWIENMSLGLKNEPVVLLEMKKSQNQPSRDDDDKAQVNLAELPIQQKQTAVVAKTEAPPPEPQKKPEAPTDMKKQGGLYRATLTVTDLDQVSPKVLEKIIGMGGKKAGEVELGWRKTEKMSYYHFTLPKDNVDSVNEFLGKFGQYKVDFENHPRLVQAGFKRFIIEVKEGD